MSFLSEHVIPGNYGKQFTTDAVQPEQLKQIEETLMDIDGIKDIIFENGGQPTVFIIHTNKVVTVKEIEDRVKLLNLHAIPTGPFFPLA